jgi:hypothetical protein
MKFGNWIAATIIAPFIFMSVGLWLTHHFNLLGVTWYYAELALSMIVGLFCLWRLPASTKQRVLLTVVFVPVSVGALFYYSLWFVCIVFGDCL